MATPAERGTTWPEFDDLDAKYRELLAEASKLTCGPADRPNTEAERIMVALDECIADLNVPSQQRLAPIQAAFWEAWADDIHALHELVKLANACKCGDGAG